MKWVLYSLVFTQWSWCFKQVRRLGVIGHCCYIAWSYKQKKMAGVCYEMSVKSTFNGFRLQMLTSSVVEIDSCVFAKRVSLSISVNRILAEYLPHHVHTAPLFTESGGYRDPKHFSQSSSVSSRLNCLVIFYTEHKCSQVLRNFYFWLDSSFSLAIFG